MLHLIRLSVLFCFVQSPLSAQTVVYDQFHNINVTPWVWRINSQERNILRIYSQQSRQLLTEYHLPPCQLCQEKDNDCRADGIFDLRLQQSLGEPVLVMVCHIDQHRRLLRIFAPFRNLTEAVKTIHADFMLEYRVLPDGIYIKHDIRTEHIENGGRRIILNQEQWPLPNDIKDN